MSHGCHVCGLPNMCECNPVSPVNERSAEDLAREFSENYVTINGKRLERPDVIEYCFVSGFKAALGSAEPMARVLEWMNDQGGHGIKEHDAMEAALKVFRSKK